MVVICQDSENSMRNTLCRWNTRFDANRVSIWSVTRSFNSNFSILYKSLLITMGLLHLMQSFNAPSSMTTHYTIKLYVLRYPSIYPSIIHHHLLEHLPNFRKSIQRRPSRHLPDCGAPCFPIISPIIIWMYTTICWQTPYSEYLFGYMLMPLSTEA